MFKSNCPCQFIYLQYMIHSIDIRGSFWTSKIWVVASSDFKQWLFLYNEAEHLILQLFISSAIFIWVRKKVIIVLHTFAKTMYSQFCLLYGFLFDILQTWITLPFLIGSFSNFAWINLSPEPLDIFDECRISSSKEYF